MAVRNITNLTGSTPALCGETILNHQTRVISSSGGNDELGREVVFKIYEIEQENLGIANLFLDIEFLLKDGYAVTQDDVDKMSIWHFIDEYRIIDGIKDRLMDSLGDEAATIAKYVLNSSKHKTDYGIIYTKDNIQRVVLTGWIPLPTNLVGVRRMSIKPDPMLTVKFYTIDLNVTKRTDRDISKSVALVKNTKHTMSRVIVQDRLSNNAYIDLDDITMMPNILRSKEKQFTINTGIKSTPLIVDLGEGNYPQAVWLIEPRNDKDASIKPTLIEKLSMTINNCEVYSVENIATKQRYNWEKGVNNDWIHYLGPINSSKKQPSFVKFLESNSSNSGCIVININKDRNRVGKYKVLVVYTTE